MKYRSVTLEEILSKELKNEEFRLAFEQRRFYLQVARLVSELRAKRKLSQAELARKAGVRQPMIARLEKGDSRRTPTFDTINRLLKALGYTLSIHVQKEKTGRAA